MITQDVKQLLDEASADLNLMSKESDRYGGGSPEFMICWTLKNCVAKFLISYLKVNEVDTSGMINISDLMQHCTSKDAAFNDVDIEQLNCRHSVNGELSACYCVEQGHMRSCIDEAKKIKDIVYRKLELNFA
ncbi:MAG TPA: hypothetical protein VI757_09565 [Bacteroidia bacterium]|nr:hypothetical protein [Bacteroidia bacterium]